MEQKGLIKKQNVSSNRKWQKTFIVNTALLVLGIAVSISGLIIQCHYHLLKNSNESTAFALNRVEWNAIHVWTSIFFLVAALGHIWAHRKWYENVLKRNFFTNHRPTILLSVLTFIVVISGLIPLFGLSFGCNPTLAFSIIEIHDKIGLLFFVVVFRHTIQRFKWYINIIRRKFQ